MDFISYEEENGTHRLSAPEQPRELTPATAGLGDYVVAESDLESSGSYFLAGC